MRLLIFLLFQIVLSSPANSSVEESNPMLPNDEWESEIEDAARRHRSLRHGLSSRQNPRRTENGFFHRRQNFGYLLIAFGLLKLYFAVYKALSNSRRDDA